MPTVLLLNSTLGCTLESILPSESLRSSEQTVLGLEVDPQARCAHYHAAEDIVAIKMRCCGVYYACKDCHIALAAHPIMVWPRSEWDQHAILCGRCKTQLTIREYLLSDARCPACRAAFNPRCRAHHHFYFEDQPGGHDR